MFSTKTGLILVLALSLVAGTGCQTMRDHPTRSGAGIGAALGAATGAAVDSSNPWRGAAIGAAAGGLVGAGVGSAIRRQREKFDEIEGLETQVVMTEQQQEAINVRIPGEVLFPAASSALSASGVHKVRDMAVVLKEYPESTIVVRGYTSSEGDDEANYRLSQRRAEVVRNELVVAGVAPGRLMAQGMGSSDPIADNATEAGRILNRRVELLVIPTQG